MELTKQKYPIGPYKNPDTIDELLLEKNISIIANFPSSLKDALTGLTSEQLQIPYRDGGWTVEQVVHHCADSHMNSFIRFKLALTEDNPTIKPYREDLWAALPYLKDCPIAISLQLLQALHTKWGLLLHSLNATQLERTFFHPESKYTYTLKEAICLYAWHCRHHLAHILQLKKRIQ